MGPKIVPKSVARDSSQKPKENPLEPEQKFSDLNIFLNFCSECFGFWTRNPVFVRDTTRNFDPNENISAYEYECFFHSACHSVIVKKTTR